MRPSTLWILAASVCVLAILTTGLPAQSDSLAIVHVTLIDATGAPAKPHMTVVVAADRIGEVGPAARVRVPVGAQVIDGTGKFLIPGLWDMHVHLGSYENARRTLPLLLAGGVTGVRDMASPLSDALRLRRETRDGTMAGPEIVTAGPILQGKLPFEVPPLVRMVST